MHQLKKNNKITDSLDVVPKVEQVLLEIFISKFYFYPFTDIAKLVPKF